jgi:hypothetical protein
MSTPAKAFGKCGSQRPTSKLTEYQVLWIRKRLMTGATQKAMAEEYKVHVNTIGRIARGLIWKHVRLES